MATSRESGSSAVIAAAAQALSAAWGGSVRLGPAEGVEGGSSRSKVTRSRVLEAPTPAPASVIVKQVVTMETETYDPDASAGDLWTQPAWHLFNDWAGIQFLSQVAGDTAPAPRFYAGDRTAGLIVMEDVGSGPGLHTLLLGNDPGAAEDALIGLAAALGQLHARTIGREAEFTQLRDALGASGTMPGFNTHDWMAPALQAVAEALAITLSPGVTTELEALRVSLSGPGPFHAYTHGDPCPDNCLLSQGTIKLIDYEVGAFRHALLDGVYGLMHFPTCWCVNRLPAPLPLRMEAVYRTELVQGCPEAAEDGRFYQAVVEACAYWALTMCLWYAIPELVDKDRDWGIATVRQRVLLRADIVARVTQEYGHLEAIGAAFGAMAAKLHRLWPSEAEALPHYPAFR